MLIRAADRMVEELFDESSNLDGKPASIIPASTAMTRLTRPSVGRRGLRVSRDPDARRPADQTRLVAVSYRPNGAGLDHLRTLIWLAVQYAAIYVEQRE